MDPKPLTEEEIQNALKDFPGWMYADSKISKEFKFNDFNSSVSFIYGIRELFDRLGHHPDVHIFYDTIRFELQRFDMGGKVTNKDFDAARIIEENFAALKEK